MIPVIIRRMNGIKLARCSGIRPEASSRTYPPEELLNTDPAALAEKLELHGTRQQDVRRTMRRLGRLQSATLETLPDFEKAHKRMAYNGVAEDFRWLALDGWEGPLIIRAC